MQVGTDPADEERGRVEDVGNAQQPSTRRRLHRRSTIVTLVDFVVSQLSIVKTCQQGHPIKYGGRCNQ